MKSNLTRSEGLKSEETPLSISLRDPTVKSNSGMENLLSRVVWNQDGVWEMKRPCRIELRKKSVSIICVLSGISSKSGS